MAHERKRDLLTVFNKVSAHSTIVGVLGHRQVGKTTFLGQVSKEYCTFDDEDTLAQATISAKKFIENLNPPLSAIDECQLAPTMFPALKEYVRKHKAPGQFILSGSVRFTSRKAIQESLTGRIFNLELLPFGVSELEKLPLPELILNCLRNDSFERFDLSTSLTQKVASHRLEMIEVYLSRGGLPGICFIREPVMRDARVQAQLTTILDRDLRLVYPTTVTYRDLLEFVRELSVHQGEPISYQELKRTSNISPQTQKKLIYALESVFVIRILPIEGDIKKFSIFFEDQAESLWLSQGRLSKQVQWETLVYRNLRLQFYYRLGLNFSFFQYRSKSGSLIPFAVRTPEGVLGVIPIIDEAPSQGQKMAAYSFLRRYQKAKVLFVSMKNISLKIYDSKMMLISAIRCLFE